MLVAEEREEWRDDQDGLVDHHRRNLVTSRLSEACRQDDEPIATGERGVDHLPLLRVELADSEATGSSLDG